MLETIGSQISEDDRLDVADMLTDGELPEVEAKPATDEAAPAAETKPDEPAADATATDATVATDPPSAEAPAEAPSEAPRVVMPQIEVGDVEEHKKAYEDAQAEIKRIRELRKAGEISSDDADEQIDALIDKRDEARNKITQHETQTQINAAVRQSIWNDALDSFTDKHKQYKHKAGFEALSVAVEEVANKFMKEGVQKTPAQILQAAHEEVQKLFGVAPSPSPAPNTAPETKPASKNAPPAPIKKPEIPMSVASLPPSGESEATDEFAYLDNLAPQELTTRMALMRKKDPDAYERYMSRA